jgi:hypothetical protein
MKCSDNANLNVLERNIETAPTQSARSVATQQSLMYTLFIRVTYKLLTTATYAYRIFMHSYT